MINKQHLEELGKSGLSLETINKAGIKSVSSMEASKLLGYSVQCGGWAVPYHHNSVWQVKPDIPLKDKTGRPRKYLLPIGKSPQLYILPTFDLSLTDYVIVTEGVKKVLKGLQEGYPVIGLQGVWNFFSEGMPIDDLEKLSKKTVYLAFDSDVMSKSQVRSALYQLTRELEKQDCRIFIATLPQTGEHKVGLDDFLMAGGDFGKILSEALSLPDWEFARNLSLQGERYDQFLKNYEHPAPIISTGFPSLDRHLYGLFKEEISVIAGRPGHGKTTMAMNICNAAAKAGHKIAFLSLEMSFARIIEKLLAIQNNLELASLISRDLPVSEVNRMVSKSKEDLKSLLIFAGADSPRSPKEIERFTIALKPDLLVIDHHKLISYGSGELRHSIGDLMTRLKLVSEVVPCAVLLLCQMNRGVEKRMKAVERQSRDDLPIEEIWDPLPSDLDEGGAIEQNAGFTLFVMRPFMYTNDDDDYQRFIGYFPKNRFGQSGRVRLSLDAGKGILT